MVEVLLTGPRNIAQLETKGQRAMLGIALPEQRELGLLFLKQEIIMLYGTVYNL